MEDRFLVLAILGLGFALSLLRARAAARERLRHAWRVAASRVNLTEIEEPRGVTVRSWLRGRSGTLHVHLDGYPRYGSAGMRIVVSGLRPGAEGLQVFRESRPLSRELATAPQAFDREFRIVGHDELALAVLDEETRGRLASLLRGDHLVVAAELITVTGFLAGGELEARIEQSAQEAEQLADSLTEVLGRVLDLARRLEVPPDLPGRIAENLRSESEADIRLRSVLLLARDYRRHPATHGALLAAREDPSDEVRLQAGLFLREEGYETLLALVGSETTEDSCAARAVAALGERLPAEQVQAALGRALEQGRNEMARACLEALERFGGPAAEGLLLRVLQSADQQTAAAAARALGRVGTAAAVVPLREATTVLPRELRSAAREAIAEIQSRLSGSPGQLSLAGGEAGALSFAGQEPGQLSLSEPEETAKKPGAAGPREGRTWA